MELSFLVCVMYIACVLLNGCLIKTLQVESATTIMVVKWIKLNPVSLCKSTEVWVDQLTDLTDEEKLYKWGFYSVSKHGYLNTSVKLIRSSALGKKKHQPFSDPHGMDMKSAV